MTRQEVVDAVSQGGWRALARTPQNVTCWGSFQVLEARISPSQLLMLTVSSCAPFLERHNGRGVEEGKLDEHLLVLSDDPQESEGLLYFGGALANEETATYLFPPS